MNRPIAMTAVLLSLLGIAPARAGEEFVTDDQGRSFRARFDPGSRVWLGALDGVGLGERASGHRLELDFGVGWRSLFRFDAEGIQWELDHRFVTGRIAPVPAGPGRAPAIDLTGYGFLFMRHAAEPYVLWPGSPPTRLFFPFDVGLEAQVGSLRLSPRSARQPDLFRLGAARAALLLDPWRPGRPGCGLSLGLLVRYDVDLIGSPGLSDPDTVHRLVPFTGGALRLRWQDEDGLTRVNARVEGWGHWATEGGWGYGLQAAARFERVLIAVNDQPVSAVVEAAADRHPPAGSVPATWEGRVQAGLSFGFQLK